MYRRYRGDNVCEVSMQILPVVRASKLMMPTQQIEPGWRQDGDADSQRRCDVK